MGNCNKHKILKKKNRYLKIKVENNYLYFKINDFNNSFDSYL